MWRTIETAPKIKDQSILLALFSSGDAGVDLQCECRMVGQWDGDQFVVHMGVTASGGWGVMATCLIPWTHWYDFGEGATMPSPPTTEGDG